LLHLLTAAIGTKQTCRRDPFGGFRCNEGAIFGGVSCARSRRLSFV